MFQKFLENGLHCLPLKPRSKFPALPAGYSTIDYSINGITPDEAEKWDSYFSLANGYGIAMFCGKASGITWIDIDTDDPEVAKLLPYSPIIKKGKTGESRAYKYNDFLNNKLRIGLDQGVKDFIEVLNDGSYTVLPPSIHPETGLPYQWIGEENLDFYNVKNLPEITHKDLELVARYYERKYPNLGVGNVHKKEIDLEGIFPALDGRCAHGSHDRLLRVASQLIHNNTPINVAVKELINYDKEHHVGVTYFEDKSRGKDSSADVETNALSFLSNIAKTINTQRIKQNIPPYKLIDSPVPLNLRTKENTKPKEKVLPAITGKMKTFVDYLNKASVSENNEIYLGASLAWLSMLVASKYAVKVKQFTTPANLMIWGILPSGVGKDSPQNLIQRLFMQHNVLGSCNYKSAPAILMSLTNKYIHKKGVQELARKAQRENLVLMDECSTLFRIVAAGENYQKDIIETLNTLFSRSNSYYAGDQSFERGANYGAAWNPYYTIMGFTTVENFHGLNGQNIVGNGFFERSLVFINEKKNPFNDNPYSDDDLFWELRNFTEKFMNMDVEYIHNGIEITPEKEILTEVHYKHFPISDEAVNAIHAYRKKMYQKECGPVDAAFYNRFAEIVTKLCLLHAVSDEKRHIDVSDVEWGVQLVEWCYSRSRPVFEGIKHNQDPYRVAFEKIKEYIEAQPNKLGHKRTIQQNIRFEPKGVRRGTFLKELIELGMFDVVVHDQKAYLKIPEE